MFENVLMVIVFFLSLSSVFRELKLRASNKDNEILQDLFNESEKRNKDNLNFSNTLKSSCVNLNTILDDKQSEIDSLKNTLNEDRELILKLEDTLRFLKQERIALVVQQAMKEKATKDAKKKSLLKSSSKANKALALKKPAKKSVAKKKSK